MACSRFGAGLITLGKAAIVLACLVSGACDNRSTYERLVDRELASGARHDSLFLGYSLGMSKDDFYDHSWSLNRQGLVMQGPQNQSVQYELPDALPFPAKMYFYPDFFEDRVYRMRIRFIYDGWAPWARRLSSDSLKLDVVHLLESWYGDGFFPHETLTRGLHAERIHVKVDGNRRIEVVTFTDKEVQAIVTDMEAERAREYAAD